VNSTDTSWRQFAASPETVSWMRLRRHLDAMPGGALVDLACDRMNEAALVFTYREHRFGVDSRDGEFRLNVEDPNCPEDVRHDVIEYVKQLVKCRLKQANSRYFT
jgi:hypothetical protein